VREIAAAKARPKDIVVAADMSEVAKQSATEAVALANGLCVGLSGLGPILDRIAQIGVDVFWHQVDERVRNQIEGTVQFLQVLATAGAVQSGEVGRP
jgi:hypothetical protein